MSSSKNASRTVMKVRWLRRLSQAAFLIIFIVLIYFTEFSFTSSTGAESQTQPSPWLNLFFNIDPLSGVATGLASWLLYGSLILGLITLIGTIFFGRFFCGWICPLGTLNQLCSSFTSERKSHRGARLIESNKYHKYQAWKYYILFGLIALAILGSVQVGLFDPITIAGRSIGMVVIPAVNAALTGLADLLYGSSIRIVSLIGAGFYQVLSGILIFFKQPHFQGIFWLALIFSAILVANRVFTRFWCRGLCPLGAFLGIISRYSVFGLHKDDEKCNDCNLCLLNCQGGDDPQRGVPHRRAECHLCLNCMAACGENALSFKFQSKTKKYKAAPDLTTRRTVIAGLAGIVAYPVIRSGDSLAGDHSFIRPPGSLVEEDFLKRCIRCGQCMKICPTNTLQPALLETGWEGIFTPVLNAQLGYCEHYCLLCGQICPTGAISKLEIETKFGRSGEPPLKIGTAFFDKGRCLPWASGVTCIVCEEWCPTSPKAIWLEEAEIVDRNGQLKKIKLPRLDPEKCTGCGACEFACPVSGKPGIYVTSADETRDPERSLLLRKKR
jgi:MauM/NapG family ferredoxin protein